jgi:hypothetical protein
VEGRSGVRDTCKIAHTVKFIERVEPLLDHRVEAQRCELMA